MRIKPIVWILLAIAALIQYEYHDRNIFDMVQFSSKWLRIAGYLLAGAVVVGLQYAPDDTKSAIAKMTYQAGMVIPTDRSSGFPSLPFFGGGGTTRDRRNVTAVTKKKVAASQNWHCGGCGTQLDETYEVDHIIPLDAGGSNDPSNLQALCPHCHRKKSLNERQT